LSKFPEKVDACIIGSGAGGGVVAKELAEKGLSVVVLEAGRRLDPLRDYTSARHDWELMGGVNSKLFTIPALSKHTVGNPSGPFKRPYEVHGLGGGTLRYLAYVPRLRPDDFRVYTEDGVAADWPITYEDLVPYYRKVEMELGVSGLAGDPWTPQVEAYPNPPFPYSYANTIIKRGCDKLGMKLWPAPMARLSRYFDGRPRCIQCGQCSTGCMSGAKSSIDVTYITKAEATGNAEVRTQSTASKITVDDKGRAKSVVYFGPDGVEHEQEARVVIVSSGSIQSPRLLLNSTSSAFPDGLANSSGIVGKYFMQHLGVFSNAIFPERIDSYRGFFGGATSQDFARTNTNEPFVRGWRNDLHSGIQGPVEMAKNNPLWGKRLKDYMRQNFGHAAGVLASGEQLPDERNLVALDPEAKDEYGLPVPRITFEWRENDKMMQAAMTRNLREIYDAAGASRILSIGTNPGGSPHNLGTCRMGSDPATSVLNSFCQSHDVSNLFVVDGSCFVTGGTANPSLTIHAIAIRASEYIVEEGKKLNL
jgi:choline dehydrogenase-like flavoprotein